MAQWLQGLSTGDWYQANGTTFEIVGVDTEAEVVLVQHFDGSLEDFEFSTWMDMAATPCAAPEDYSGALDMDHEDLVLEDIPAPSREEMLKRLVDGDTL